MDAFVLVVLGAFIALVLFVWLLGRYYPGSGLEQIGLRSAREIVETREELEARDLDQMIEAHNVRRRARGEAELTATEVEMRVMRELREQQQRREEYVAERELDQLLEVTNARRRKRGLPERSREEAKEEFGGNPRREG